MSIIKKITISRRIFRVGVATLMLIPTLSIANSVMFQANLERTGVYDDIGPEDTPELLWKFDTGAPVISTPLVYEGIVHFVDFEGGIYALSQDDGAVIWEKNLGGQPSFEITLNENILLVGRRFSREDDESYLLALDRLSGEELWRFMPNDDSGMDYSTIYNNMVFLVSMSSNLFAVDIETGDEIWRLPILGGSRPPLLSENILYLQDSSQAFFALSPENGEKIWSHPAISNRERYSNTPAIHECCIYALTVSQENWLINEIDKYSGEIKAEFPIEFASLSSISLADKVIFFGDEGEGHADAHGYMNAMDTESGELVWRFETGGFVRGAASIAGDTVYFGSHDHYMYAVDRHTGEMKWRYETDAGIASSPAIVDGRMYFGSIDGHVYVLE